MTEITSGRTHLKSPTVIGVRSRAEGQDADDSANGRQNEDAVFHLHLPSSAQPQASSTALLPIKVVKQTTSKADAKSSSDGLTKWVDSTLASF